MADSGGIVQNVHFSKYFSQLKSCDGDFQNVVKMSNNKVALKKYNSDPPIERKFSL